MQLLALLVLIAAGLWLIGIGLVMALWPDRTLQLLRLAGSSHRANVAELVPRMLVGAAMIVRAEATQFATIFQLTGMFVAVSSLVLLSIPLAWHSGFAIWWADRIPLAAVRALAPLSATGGAALIYMSW